jgi:HD superfamily phosphohydrolase
MTTIRDPLWNNIRVDAVARQLLDTPALQRLRYVRQLGLAHLVYPGATHSRFEHALGAYHLAKRTLHALAEAGALAGVAADEPAIVAATALLHDVGHYPFSHALEEIGVAHHEEVARDLITGGEAAAILRKEYGNDAPARVMALIQGKSASPLQGLISGSLDLDKIDYLKRDAKMCGVPYGEIDEDRLIFAIVLLADPTTGRTVTGVRAKALSALESLLFAKYQMYRNVYWHHAVRSATAMYKRLVEDALSAKELDAGSLVRYTDEGLLHALAASSVSALNEAIRMRRLFKRAFETPAALLEDKDLEWIATDRDRVRAAEARLAKTAGLAPGELLLDYPAKTQMLSLDLPVLMRDESVVRLTAAGLAGAIDLPVLSDKLYKSARWLRVFTATRVTLSAEQVFGAFAAK